MASGKGRDTPCTSAKSLNEDSCDNNKGLHVAKKRKLRDEYQLEKVTCALKNSLHLLKDPVRLPCNKKLICRRCMWMANPNDKSFNCGFCKKRHIKCRIDYEDTKTKTAVKKGIESNLKDIVANLLQVAETKIEEASGRWKNYEEIIEGKVSYFVDELEIARESANVKLDLSKEEILAEYEEKMRAIVDETQVEDDEKALHALTSFFQADVNFECIDSFAYLKSIQNLERNLDAYKSKYDSLSTQLVFEPSSVLPPKTSFGKFLIGSVDFSAKFENVVQMDRIAFEDNKEAVGGRTICIDVESNIIVLCPSTHMLVKMSVDAKKILCSVNLTKLLDNNKMSDMSWDEVPITLVALNDISDSDFASTSEHDSDEPVINESKCNNNSQTAPKKVQDSYTFFDMCVSEHQFIYIAYKDHSQRRNFLVCVDQNMKIVFKKCMIDSTTRSRIRNYGNRNFLNHMICHTSGTETRLYISFSDSLLVYDSNGKFLGEIHLYEYNRIFIHKIVARKHFTYFLTGCGQRIHAYEMNINEFEIDRPNGRNQHLQKEIIDCELYGCKSVRAFYGDDMGNCIYIGKCKSDKKLYLYSVNFHGELLYRTLLFNRKILSIEIDYNTSMNYRLLVTVQSKKDLLWIFEFENRSYKPNEDQNTQKLAAILAK